MAKNINVLPNFIIKLPSNLQILKLNLLGNGLEKEFLINLSEALK